MATEDTDPGFAKLLKSLDEIQFDTVAVGLFEESGNEPDSEYTTVQVGAVHEFGCDTAGKNHNIVIPQRSFLRSTVDAETAKISEMMDNAISDGIKYGREGAKSALAKIGVYVSDAVKKRIADGIDPANVASTRARKGSSKPLVDTGHMRNSITFKVRPDSENLSEGTVEV